MNPLSCAVWPAGGRIRPTRICRVTGRLLRFHQMNHDWFYSLPPGDRLIPRGELAAHRTEPQCRLSLAREEARERARPSRDRLHANDRSLVRAVAQDPRTPCEEPPRAERQAVGSLRRWPGRDLVAATNDTRWEGDTAQHPPPGRRRRRRPPAPPNRAPREPRWSGSRPRASAGAAVNYPRRARSPRLFGVSRQARERLTGGNDLPGADTEPGPPMTDTRVRTGRPIPLAAAPSPVSVRELRRCECDDRRSLPPQR